MEKQLFDEQGLQRLLESLYALTDQELEKEVYALEAQFADWIERHFELNDSQRLFFKRMDERMLRFLTQQCGFAAGNRLPILLQKTTEVEAMAKDEEGDKLFEPKSKLQASTDAAGNFEAGGSLVIQVSYT